MSTRFVLLGIIYAALWATASAVAKYAFVYIEPLALFQIRFFLAGLLLLFWAHGIKKERFPKSTEWKQLAIFGLLNTTLYLSLFSLGLQQSAAGIGSLATSTNTLFISVIAFFWMGEPLNGRRILALFLGISGVALACLPFLQSGETSLTGLILLLLCMLAYAIGTIYYSKVGWSLSKTAINGWQVLFGGIFLLPLTWYFHVPGGVVINQTVVWATIWLVGVVSIVAVQLWLQLLKTDTVRASFFLFLCPVFGFVYAFILLGEPFTWNTLAGTFLVLVGLYLGTKK